MPAAPRRVPGMRYYGQETITLNNTTSSRLNSTNRAGTLCMFSVETTDARVGYNTTAPLNATGVVFAAGLGPYFLPEPLTTLRFCRSGTSGTSTIQVMVFKQAGD